MTGATAERELYPWEIRALKTAHRRVRIGIGGGECRWCGKVILGKRGKYIGKPDPARSWCRDEDGGSPCVREYNLHSDSQTQFSYLEATRGLCCAWCKVEDPKAWRSFGTSWGGMGSFPPMPWEGERKGQAYFEAIHAYRRRCLDEFPDWGLYTPIEQITGLQVDHVIPLWKVALEIPEDQRRPYFGPDNLQLLCMKCHKIKTSQEAAERAAIKAFAKSQLILPL